MPEVLPLYDQTGQPIPADKLADAVKNRAAFVPEGGKVGMVTPDGKHVAVPSAQYEKALGSGLMPETWESQRQRVLESKHQGVGEQAATFGEGLVRSIPLGEDVSNLLGGEAYRQRKESRVEVFPKTALAGEVTGLAGQVAAETLLTGGLGAAAEAGTVARVARRGAEVISAPSRLISAAGRGVERVVEGLGPTRAERVLEAATSAGVKVPGRLLSAIEQGGPAAEQALAKLATKAGEAGKAIEAAAEAPRVARLASSATQGALWGGSMAAADTALHGQDLTAERLVHAMGTGAMFGVGADLALGAASAGLKRVFGSSPGKAVAEGLESVQAERALSATGVTGAQMRKLASSGRPEEIAARAEELGRELATYRFDGTAGKAGDSVLKAWSKNSELAEPIQQAVEEVGAKWRAQADRVSKAIQAHPELAPDANGIITRVENEVLAPLTRELSGDAQAAAKHVAAEFSEMFDRLGAGKSVTWDDLAQLKSRLGDKVYNEGIGIGLPAPVKMANRPLQAAQRIVADEVNKSAENALAAIGEDPAAWRAMNAQMGRWLDLRKIIRSSAPPGGNRSLSLTDNMHGGVGAALAGMVTGHFGTAALAGVGSAIGHKFLRERGSAMMSVTAGRLAGLTRRASNATAKIAGVETKGWLSRTVPLVVAMRQIEQAPPRMDYSQDQVNERIKQIQQTALLPESEQIRRASSALGSYAEAYPTAAAATVQVALNKQAYLASQLPKPRTPKTLTSKPPEEPQIPKVEQERMGRIIKAVDDPEGVLEDIADGKVDPDAIKAVSATSPTWWNEQRENVANLIAQRDEPLPIGKALAIGLAFDLPTTPELIPEEGLAAQQAFAQAAQAAQEEPKRGNVSAPKNSATRSQEIEGRERPT